MKSINTFERKTIYAAIIENMTFSDIANGLAWSSDLYAEYANAYDAETINSDVAEFLKENMHGLDVDEVAEILQSPDWIITQAARVFRESLAESMQGNSERLDDAFTRADYILNNANKYRGSGGSFYIFADPIANAWTRYYIVRADDLQDAYASVTTEFESHFIVDDQDDVTDDTPTNDNGNYINTDNLQCLVELTFEKE